MNSRSTKLSSMFDNKKSHNSQLGSKEGLTSGEEARASRWEDENVKMCDLGLLSSMSTSD